jgi:catalase
MDEPTFDPAKPPSAGLTRRSVLGGLAAVGGIGAASLGGFLYAGGWFSPGRLTPSRFADRFEQVFGRHPGFRRNHAKGVAATGHFDSSGAGAVLSGASVFAPGRTAVTGRFSLSGGMPFAHDAPATVRGLGLLFHLPAGEQWRTAMVNIPVFTDRVPEGFFARLAASKPDPTTGKPDPAAMARFLAAFPETARAMAYIKAHPPSSGFADSTFHGLNAFRLIGGSGRTTPVRWRLVPHDPVAPAASTRPPGRDDLFTTLVRRAAQGPLRWDLQLVVAEPGDPTDDATTAWPPGRRTVTAGTLTLDELRTEAPGNARDVNFDPLVLPIGISPSDDPLLSARSAVYSVSYTRRAGEPHTPSAVQIHGGTDGA